MEKDSGLDSGLVLEGMLPCFGHAKLLRLSLDFGGFSWLLFVLRLLLDTRIE